MSSGPVPRLRPEARAARWQELSIDQRYAFGRVLSGLSAAVAALDARRADREERHAPPRRAARDALPWLAVDRATRLAFVSGGRGTGKTTALLSLAQATVSHGTRWQLDESGPDGDSHGRRAGEHNPATVPVEVEGDLRSVRGRLVWLEPLDLEACPESVNVIAAILARIEDAIDLGGSPIASDGLLSHAVASGAHAVLGELRRVLANVAVAWDGNLESHKPQMDQDDYAVEVRRTEMARLRLNPSLEDLLEKLADARLWGPNVSDPLFVLPIDDFDLSPILNLALLHLLRLISVPRLFVVIMGDLRITEKVVELKLGGDFARVSSPAGDRVLEHHAPEVAGLVGEVAANAMTKLLPLSQRHTLHPMQLREALEFTPLGAKGPTMQDLLARVPVREAKARPPLTVLHLLLSGTPGDSLILPSGAPNLELIDKQLKDSAYPGLQAFRTTPRRLTDLWIALRDEMPQERSLARRSAIYRVRDALLSAIAESPSLTADQRASLRAATSEGSAGGAILGVRVRAKVSSARTLRWSGADPSMQAPEGVSARFEFGNGGGWVMSAQPRADVISQRKLDPLATASAALLHDMARVSGDAQAEQRANDTVSIDFGCKWLARTVWTFPDETRVVLPWATPPATTFFDFDRFASAWRRFTSQPGVETKVEKALCAWIYEGLSLIHEEATTWPAPPPHTNWDWEHVAKRADAVVASIGSLDQQRYEVHRWLRDVAAMLMPECGIPQETFHEFVTMLGGSSLVVRYWSDHAPAIRRRRASNILQLVEAGMRSAWTFSDVRASEHDEAGATADLYQQLRIREGDRRRAHSAYAAHRHSGDRQEQTNSDSLRDA